MIYKAIGSNDYTVFVATAKFSNGAPLELPEVSVSSNTEIAPIPFESKVRKTQDVVTSWKQLENKECISTYGARFLAGRRDLVVFADTSNLTESYSGVNGSLLAYTVVQMGAFIQDVFAADPLDWMCDSSPPFYGFVQRCTPKLIDPSNWTVYGQKIQHCRSERVEEHCRLYFNRTIGIVVVLWNFIKLCCMIIAASKLQQNELCTIGYVGRHFAKR